MGIALREAEAFAKKTINCIFAACNPKHVLTEQVEQPRGRNTGETLVLWKRHLL
jgi:hypothetical protein